MNTAGVGQQSIEQGNDGVMTRAIDGRISSWSHGAEKLYGWRKEEAIGKVSHRLLKTQFPQPLEEIESEFLRARRWEGKLVHTTRDGGRVVVESRWALKPEGHSDAVVEMNRRQQEPPAANAVIGVLSKIATMVLAAGSLLCVIVLVHFLSRYHSTGSWAMPSTVGLVVYHLLPALLAGLLLASLWLSPHLKINLALCLCSTGAAVYMVESVATFWESLPSELAERNIVARATAAKEWGVEFDRRTKLEVVTDLRKNGVDAYPAIPAEALRKAYASGKGLLPLAGISNKVSVLCNENGAYTIYESDEHGFHNPKGLWNTRVDIAALGDSFVQGYCVSVDDNFVALIRKQYPATLNLGVAGQGPLMTLATLKEYVRIVKPSVVLWFYCEGNDLENLIAEKDHPALMAYLVRGFDQGLIRRQAEVDQALSLHVNAEMGRSELSRRLGEVPDAIAEMELQTIATRAVKLGNVRRALGLIDDDRRKPDRQVDYPEREYTGEVKELFREVMVEAKSVVSGWGGRLYFVYLPDMLGNREDQEEVMGVVRSLEIPVIDMPRAFRAHGDAAGLFPFRMVGQHYNEVGNRLVAAQVLGNLNPTEVIR